MICLIYNLVPPVQEFGISYILLSIGIYAVIAALAAIAILITVKAINKKRQIKLLIDENKEV